MSPLSGGERGVDQSEAAETPPAKPSSAPPTPQNLVLSAENQGNHNRFRTTRTFRRLSTPLSFRL